MKALRERYGRWAVVAGASEGIGAELATQLAGHGLDLVLIARRPEPLEALAAELRAAHSIEVRCLAHDLGQLDELHRIAGAVAALDVGLLIVNAAYAPIGEFLSITEAQHLTLLEVNCRAAAVLSRHFGERFAAQGRGGLVFLSSLASLQGVALTAHYAATKAYLRVLAEGLWEELRPRGVDVLAALAGATATPAWEASAAKPGRLFPVQQPAAVAKATLAALGSGPICYTGVANALSATLMRLLPTRLAVRLVSNTTRSLYRR